MLINVYLKAENPDTLLKFINVADLRDQREESNWANSKKKEAQFAIASPFNGYEYFHRPLLKTTVLLLPFSPMDHICQLTSSTCSSVS